MPCFKKRKMWLVNTGRGWGGDLAKGSGAGRFILPAFETELLTFQPRLFSGRVALKLTFFGGGKINGDCINDSPFFVDPVA